MLAILGDWKRRYVGSLVANAAVADTILIASNSGDDLLTARKLLVGAFVLTAAEGDIFKEAKRARRAVAAVNIDRRICPLTIQA